MNNYNQINIYGVEYPCPNNQKWQLEMIEDFPMTEEEYKVFSKGYSPDWKCRYAPFFFENWHYITHSGFWLKKISYEKRKDGLYHIVQQFSTEKELGRNLLKEILIEGYFQPPLCDVVKRVI